MRIMLGVIGFVCGAYWCWQIGYQFALRSQEITTMIVGEDLRRQEEAKIIAATQSIRIIDGDREFVLLPHQTYVPSTKSVLSDGENCPSRAAADETQT